MSKKYNILYVDDEISNLNVFKNTFRRDYNIFTAESAEAGLEILDREEIDLILTDQRMPEISGVDFLKHVMLKYPDPTRILITAYSDFNVIKDAINEAKIFQYIQKPWDEKETQQIINSALDLHCIRQKNIQLTEKLSANNEELERLNKELLELDKLKFQFLNIISHEIRTPLNGLVGATSLFKSSLTGDDFLKYQEMFDILEISTKRLEHFLLLAERITAFKADRYKVNPEVINLGKLVHESVKVLKNRLSEKNLKLEFDLKTDDKSKCYAEKQLIEICLNEIIDNAIKHSDIDGKIIIKTDSKDDQILLEIIDSGPGFSEIVLKNIFQPFITEDDLTNKGMGLDLALIKLIIDAHNGSISIRNNDHTGSTVQLIFKKHTI
jgi:signal transduction histidine kinase